MSEIAFRHVEPYVCATCGYTVVIFPCVACCTRGILPDHHIPRPALTHRDHRRRVYLTAAALAGGAGSKALGLAAR